MNLIEEGIDLALRAGRLADSTLVARKLGQSDLGLFASAQYLKQHPAPKNVQGLESHAFVLFRARQGRQRVRLQSGAKERELTLRGAISSDDLGFVRALTAQGLGIGLLPVMMVASCGAKADGFERVLPAWTVPGPPVHVVMPASKYVPRRVRLLADFLYEKIRAEVWR